MLLIRLIFLPVTLALLVLRLTYRIVRIVRIRRLLVFGTGVGVGLLVAPTTGVELRERIRRELEARQAPSDLELADRVRSELSQSPRTWHLPQPTVEVVGGTAVLRGEVPHDDARADLEGAARSVSGITGLDSHLTVNA